MVQAAPEEVAAPPKKLRYEFRPKGTPFMQPMRVIEVDSEEEALAEARRELLTMQISRPRADKVTVKLGIVHTIELTRIK